MISWIFEIGLSWWWYWLLGIYVTLISVEMLRVSEKKKNVGIGVLVVLGIVFVHVIYGLYFLEGILSFSLSKNAKV